MSTATDSQIFEGLVTQLEGEIPCEEENCPDSVEWIIRLKRRCNCVENSSLLVCTGHKDGFMNAVAKFPRGLECVWCSTEVTILGIDPFKTRT